MSCGIGEEVVGRVSVNVRGEAFGDPFYGDMNRVGVEASTCECEHRVGISVDCGRVRNEDDVNITWSFDGSRRRYPVVATLRNDDFR